ncbi:dephospho-CoA kinase [Metabacillus arenae]|uniref:Dephospho-CoA kinase n=1 Tax=Metabacillus arenae TaxID=2771434 RepID=A0A926NL84_9BACI|nr:dephospho-CoA kinase [Metabacillus arenae]MBD1380082.1 dephospho-CoA kinase [Metabacillus arenae]
MTLVIGLTGGIASGKSTVSAMFQKLEIPVIDADLISREVVEIGKPAYEQIISSFGDGIIQRDGSINRELLGSIIFKDENKRLQLNQIVHPAVREEMLRQKGAAIKNKEAAVVLDIPLLFESKLTSFADVILLVYVDEAIQLKRLMNRNHLSKEDALLRIKSQMPLKEKVPLADAVIDNNGTISSSEKQLKEQLIKWNVL